MSVCDACGNDYDKAFTITRGEESGVFDSFECAIATMAPSCAHCGCRVMGHGVEADHTIFCCSHCAREMGHPSATDAKS